MRVLQAKQRRQRSRRFHGISSRNVRALLSSLVIPLIFGVITIIVTLRQQQQTDRHFDVRMNFSRQQQLGDDIKSQNQRDLDRNISQMQRESDRNIANMHQEARSNTAIEQYRNRVFLDYIKEISVLLKESNGSLTSNSLTHAIARVKTLTVLQQLDGLRQQHIIDFLYEARQLTNTNESNALDISTADLANIDFHKSLWLLCKNKISLAGVFLQNSTFHITRLCGVNFSTVKFRNVSFILHEERQRGFGPLQLYIGRVDFLNATLNNVNFSSVDFDHIGFPNAAFTIAEFSFSLHRGTDFSNAYFESVNFSSARLFDVNFSTAQLADVNFSFTSVFETVNFSSALLYNVTFSSASPHDVTFSSALLAYVTFSSASLHDVTFSSALLYHVIFSSAFFNGADFSSVFLHNVTFSSAEFRGIES
jgi:uncharacterized protein YjbI with pentapeptide repeats